MSSVVSAIDEVLRTDGRRLVKATPRSAEHLLLEAQDRDGNLLAGQWFADPARAERVCAATRGAAPSAGVRRLGHGHVVLQPGGADRRLRRLPGLVEARGARLVAHRPERRGVVRQAWPDGGQTYTKLVPTQRIGQVVRGARLTLPGVETPRVTHVDERLGAVTFEALPGRPLFELLGDASPDTARIDGIGRAVGEVVARLHRVEPPAGLPRHDAAAELAVTRRWVRLAAQHGLLAHRSQAVEALWRTARDRLSSLPTGPTAVVHRDLHDKQILVDDTQVGLLDFDLAAAGDPALDLANLLVHLDLRVLQGCSSRVQAQACARAIRQAYGVRPDVYPRILAYQLTTRIRLACVYAFRPRHAAAAKQLLVAPPLVEASSGASVLGL